jgi:calcium/calmodulin-dependent protein kinase (CaM kinase) II
MNTANSTSTELLTLTRQLLEAIAGGDWAAYARLCHPSLTAFEPESCGHLVEGLEFHKFYFDKQPPSGGSQSILVSPQVRILGDAALVCYTRLIQKRTELGEHQTLAFQETRVWHKTGGSWLHVHFHRSQQESRAA